MVRGTRLERQMEKARREWPGLLIFDLYFCFNGWMETVMPTF
jgi:hypothetical protein